MDIDLFSQFSIGKLKLKNRFVRSATWDGMADNDRRVTIYFGFKFTIHPLTHGHYFT